MPGDIRDHAVLHSASARLKELIAACQRGGNLHGHAPNLAVEVRRKARALHTALAGLITSLETGVDAQPEPSTARKPHLRYRLYADPVLYETHRFVGHAGRSELEFWDYYRELAGQYGQERASAAYSELCDLDKSCLPATVLLKPSVRILGGPLLGAPPSGPGR
jgi:hypothetical protein